MDGRWGRKFRYHQLLPSSHPCTLKVGLPWTYVDFVSKALAQQRPISKGSVASAPDALQAAFNILTLGPSAVIEKRRKFVLELKSRELSWMKPSRSCALACARTWSL